MQFTKLRLTGFKSFVEPVELAIEPGVTGIVGPNGCGKSNLVEALRWVMGENSARRVRGSEMDDVIFGGGGGRPARNLAEVVLTADNSAHTAPGAFNAYDELEISRHIERGAGSTYRVNGRISRARDIQILFQDHQTGSTSPALVGQGQIGAIVSAKPADRRRLLEEAAGISGLHGRRHEAELRLNAAEANLRRLDDILATMAEQLVSLKKQARHAARYRSLSDRIRTAEATLYLVRWQAASEALQIATSARDAAERTVADALTKAAAATTEADKADAALPPLRQAYAEAAARLQRLTIACEQLAAEEARSTEARRQAADRLAQLQADEQRERELSGDAESAVARLEADTRTLRDGAEGQSEAQDTARNRLEAALGELRAADSGLDEKTTELAASEAKRQSLEARVEDLERQAEKAAALCADLTRQRAEMERRPGGAETLAEASDRANRAAAALASARERAEQTQSAAEQAEADRDKARAEAREADARHAALAAEIDALRAVLDDRDTDLFPPLIDAVTVEPGYELAFAAALGEDVMIPLDEAAPAHWATLPPLDGAQPFPPGIEPLSTVVRAPAALKRRLAHIGIARDASQAAKLAASLAPGQQIVSRDGGHWRWDGLVVTAGEETAAAKRLRQSNRLAELRPLCDAAAREKGTAEEAGAAQDVRLGTARTDAQEARGAVTAALDDLEKARVALSAIEKRLAEEEAAIQRLAQQGEEAASAETAVREELAAARDSLAGQPDLEALRAEVQAGQSRRAELRAAADEAKAGLDGLVREAESRAERLQSLERDAADWSQRAGRATERLSEFEVRITEAQAALAALDEAPAKLARQQVALQDEVDTAERGRAAAADALAEAESHARETHTVLKQAEERAVEAREARATAAGRVQTASESQAQLTERIAEKLECTPGDLRAIAGLKPEAELPVEEAASARVERLYNERETMGAVNLRAEEESAETEERIAGLESEKADVEAASAELRRGIANLNREARERLTACFDEVDGHFRSLFTRLFGGGKAYLKLTDPDDPLNAGLEIFASPPGKRLQNLSLLSGGERALTALALLFAVFLTNPAPICVLDEVDAPLDDANVDRFCTLVEDLVAKAGTRFIVVTHHRMTMARVDRLIGVTMPEAGVSQVVTVDLDQAVALRDAG